MGAQVNIHCGHVIIRCHGPMQTSIHYIWIGIIFSNQEETSHIANIWKSTAHLELLI